MAHCGAVVKSGGKAETTTLRETLVKTGVHCAVRQRLSDRLHPVTGVLCEHFLCEYLTGEATNSDAVEHIDFTWDPRKSVPRFLPVDRIF